MKTTCIYKKATYYHYQITIIINKKVVDYDVHIAVTKDKTWVQNYGKIFIIRLTTSERKQIKKYIENDFISALENNETSESGFDLHFVSGSAIDECPYEVTKDSNWDKPTIEHFKD